MEITFQLTPDDFWNALRYQLRRAARSSPLRYLAIGWNFLWGFLVGIGSMLLYRYALDLYCVDDKRLIWGVSFAFAGIAVLVLNPVVAVYVQKRVMFAKGGFYTAMQSITIDDGHLLHRCSATESRIAWADIVAVEEDATYLYIFLDQGMAIPIPRRAFDDSASFHNFAGALAAHVPHRG